MKCSTAAYLKRILENILLTIRGRFIQWFFDQSVFESVQKRLLIQLRPYSWNWIFRDLVVWHVLTIIVFSSNIFTLQLEN